MSIHALRGEGDVDEFHLELNSLISIHALRGEGDSVISYTRRTVVHFNPRPPWGGRLLNSLALAVLLPIFQSTPSVGRAISDELEVVDSLDEFQSTPSVGRATPSLVKSVIIVLFQSTPSVGRATALPDPPKKSIEISIHALRGEGDFPRRRVL